MPTTHNDGRRVDDLLLEQTWQELVARFSGMTLVPHTVLGIWAHAGMRYEEEMRRLMVDVDEASDHVEFFTKLKEALLARFEQIEIYIVSYPIDVL